MSAKQGSSTPVLIDRLGRLNTVSWGCSAIGTVSNAAFAAAAGLSGNDRHLLAYSATLALQFVLGWSNLHHCTYSSQQPPPKELVNNEALVHRRIRGAWQRLAVTGTIALAQGVAGCVMYGDPLPVTKATPPQHRQAVPQSASAPLPLFKSATP